MEINKKELAVGNTAYVVTKKYDSDQMKQVYQNDVLCLSEEDAKKHILKQNLLMKFRNKRFCENDCNLDQLLLMKAGYFYDPTGPMAKHWQKILEYEKGNF